ncbi:ArnT family glycosyltransferase [Paenibacillus sp. 1P07SE]|uniref:ArnT family glycosyltransferase n=1 Tax=Paenibacillus sp. 1P07SE TaxID=3132209 RepID=UPI0039A65279
MVSLRIRYSRLNKTTAITLLVILAAAAILRFDFLFSTSHQVSHDTIHYDAMVRQLLEEGIYAYKSTEPNAQVTPGYPLFMAAVYILAEYTAYEPFALIRILQVGFSLISIGLGWAIAARLAGRHAGLLTAAAMAVYPPFIWANGAILTEPLAAMLLLLYIWLQLLAFERQRWTIHALAGAAMGLTVLVRPEFLVLLGASYALLLIRSGRMLQTARTGLIALLGAALVLSPWVIRNVATLGEFVVASTQVNPFAAGTYPGKNYEDGLVDRRGKTQMEVAKERLRIGFTEHTWTYVKWYTIGKLKFTYGRMFFGSGHSPLYPVIPLRQPVHLAIVFAGALSALLMLRRWRQPAMLLVVLLGTISVTRLAFVPEYRYNFTAMPLLIILGSMLAVAVWQRWRQRMPSQDTITVKEAESHA